MPPAIVPVLAWYRPLGKRRILPKCRRFLVTESPPNRFQSIGEANAEGVSRPIASGDPDHLAAQPGYRPVVSMNVRNEWTPLVVLSARVRVSLDRSGRIGHLEEWDPPLSYEALDMPPADSKRGEQRR